MTLRWVLDNHDLKSPAYIIAPLPQPSVHHSRRVRSPSTPPDLYILLLENQSIGSRQLKERQDSIDKLPVPARRVIRVNSSISYCLDDLNLNTVLSRIEAPTASPYSHRLFGSSSYVALKLRSVRARWDTCRLY